MKMTGEQRIAAPRERVWAALNDPDILRRSIPGCQSLEQEPDGRLRAVVEVKIGPIGARFNGVVSISDATPPESYTITGEGQGGTVGSAKGGANVRLSDDKGGTLLSYEVDAQVGGRLAQLGGPIIDATAKQLAAKFFRQFGDLVGPGEGAGAVAAVAEPVSAPGVAIPPRAPTPAGWLYPLGIALFAFLIGFLVGSAPEEFDRSVWIGLLVGALAAAATLLLQRGARR